MKFTLNDIPVYERPRERLQAYGVEALSLQELLAIIVAQGGRRGSVYAVCQQLISQYKTLNGLDQASIKELCSIAGIGSAKATQIKAALEIGKRFYSEDFKPKADSVLTSFDAYKIAMYYLADKKKEHLLLFCLDVHCKPIARPEILSVGLLDCSLVHPREIFGFAIKNNSAKIILAHNHPSGNSVPSVQDLEVTKQVCQAGKIMGIELLDHIVLGSGEYTSIREQHSEIFD